MSKLLKSYCVLQPFIIQSENIFVKGKNFLENYVISEEKK